MHKLTSRGIPLFFLIVGSCAIPDKDLLSRITVRPSPGVFESPTFPLRCNPIIEGFSHLQSSSLVGAIVELSEQVPPDGDFILRIVHIRPVENSRLKINDGYTNLGRAWISGKDKSSIVARVLPVRALGADHILHTRVSLVGQVSVDVVSAIGDYPEEPQSGKKWFVINEVSLLAIEYRDYARLDRAPTDEYIRERITRGEENGIHDIVYVPSNEGFYIFTGSFSEVTIPVATRLSEVSSPSSYFSSPAYDELRRKFDAAILEQNANIRIVAR
jgi:hypothetical protein